MKKSIGFLMIIMLALGACKEEPPGINFKPKATTLDTTYMVSPAPSPDAKEILLEDVTGVACQNCPEAAGIAAGIVAQHPGRVNVVSLYNTISSSLGKPINDPPHVSKYDFRNIQATDITQMVGVPASLPSGYINRKKFTGKTDPIMPKDEWVSNVESELNEAAPVNIEVEAEYHANDGTLTADLLITYTASFSSTKHYLSVMILEDSIIDVQETKSSNGLPAYINDYVHKHVFIDMYTASTGDLLNVADQITLVPGRVFKKRFTKKVTPFVNPQKLKVLAFVHEDPTTKYVLQSKEADVE